MVQRLKRKIQHRVESTTGQRDGVCAYGRGWTSLWRPLDVTNGAPWSNIAGKPTARVIMRPSARRSVSALEIAWALRGQCAACHVLRMGCRGNPINYNYYYGFTT